VATLLKACDWKGLRKAMDDPLTRSADKPRSIPTHCLRTTYMYYFR